MPVSRRRRALNTPAKQLLERFGGALEVAELLGVPASTVNNWPGTGIPPKRWPALLDLAERMEITLSLDELRGARGKGMNDSVSSGSPDA